MDFFNKYFKYVGATEAPMIYHRWTCISMLGALLGRQVWVPFGHSNIYPNQYIMLMGSPGTRKGTAMNIGKRLLKDFGYTRFCPDKLSKEQFLKELKPYDTLDFDMDTDLENLVVDAPYEIYALAEEFTDLVGQGGMEFMTMLTKLWDNMDTYTHPKITGKSVVVDKPTVNLYGGNTVQGLALAIPPEALGNGFMSRIIFVFAEPTEKKISFPVPPSPSLKNDLLEHMKNIREIRGEISFTEEARKVFDKIYKSDIGVDDPRFRHYSTRRFTHLLKLSSIIAVSDLRKEITKEDAIAANTILHFAEKKMPRALGEFGKNRHSEAANIIVEALEKRTVPMSMKEVWKLVAKDMTKFTELTDLMKNLVTSGRVQVITLKGTQGYMNNHEVLKEWPSDLLDEGIMLPEEIF